MDDERIKELIIQDKKHEFKNVATLELMQLNQEIKDYIDELEVKIKESEENEITVRDQEKTLNLCDKKCRAFGLYTSLLNQLYIRRLNINKNYSKQRGKCNLVLGAKSAYVKEKGN